MKKYSLIKGYPIDYNETGDDNHVYIHLLSGNKDYSLAVNIASNLKYSRLFYHIETYEMDAFLKRMHISDSLPDDLYRLDTLEKTIYLDYKELGLFDKNYFRSAEGSMQNKNSLQSMLRENVKKTIQSPSSYILSFGSLWGPKENETDWTFHFKPGQGLHDIHCNQYSPALSSFAKGDAPKSDGGIFFVNVDKKMVTGFYFIFMAKE